MDDFGMLAKDFGFRPSGKSAPMKSTGVDRPNKPVSNDIFNDVVYSSSPNFTNNNSKSTPSISDYDYDYDSLFKDSNNSNNINNKAKSKPKSNSNMNSNSPVYNKPLYDDDIFEGLAGMKRKPVFSSSRSVRYDDNIFASMTTSPPQQSKQSIQSDQFDDLLGSLGRTEKAESIGHSNSDMSSRGLDDLIPGFGSGSSASINRYCYLFRLWFSCFL